MASSRDDADDNGNGFLFSSVDPNPNHYHHHHHHPQPPSSPPVLPSSAAAASEVAESAFATDEDFGPTTDPEKSRSDKRRGHEELSDGGTTPTSYAYKKSKSVGTAVGSDYRKDREEWSETAITCLLDAYVEKFTTLNRGNLRGRDWDEVAAIVSERCGKQAKSVEQCKNKVDNLKKRFKLERHRMSNGVVAASNWPWYRKLEEVTSNILPTKSAANEEKGGNGGGGSRGGAGEVSTAPARQSKR